MYDKLAESFQLIEKKQKEIRSLKDIIREYEANDEGVSYVTEQHLDDELEDGEKLSINMNAKALDELVFYDKVKMDKQVKGSVPLLNMNRMKEKIKGLKGKEQTVGNKTATQNALKTLKLKGKLK